MPGSFLTIMQNFDFKMSVFVALEDLLRETSIDKISVKKICKEANVSHATFYRYFKDKFDVGQWYTDYTYSLGTNKIGRTLTWQDGYYLTESAMLEHRDFFVAMSSSKDANSIDNYAPRARRQILTETVVDVKHAKLTEKMRFDIDATIALETNLFPAWHYGKYDASLVEITSWVADAVPRDLYNLLELPRSMDMPIRARR